MVSGRLSDTKFFETMDLILHWAVALLLVVVAAAVFVDTIGILISGVRHDFMTTVLHVVNNLLFVIIILEVLSTVTSHFRSHDFALKPFLIVGTISVVRHLLIVGARMSMIAETSQQLFQKHLLELFVNGVLALILVVAYFLVMRAESSTRPSQDK